MANPACCGCTLQKATIIIAIIDMVSCVLGAIGIIISGAVTIYAISTAPNDNRRQQDQQFNQGVAAFAIGVIIVVYLLSLISIMITFGLSWMLKTAAENKNPERLRLWLIVTIVCLAISSFIYFFLLFVFIIVLIPGLLYRLWTLWVVYEYRKEIQPISQAGVVYASGPAHQQQYSA